MRTRLSAVLVIVSLLSPSMSMAIRFPDVSTSYPHRDAIEKLTDLGVIGGNPDGKFHPTDPVNRAAMLKMLYLAAKMEPEKSGGCFSDVQLGSWYENFVCDAATRGFVQGYAGGVFKPGQAVTRAEAIKLAIAVFGIPQADVTVALTMYSDVPAGEWFASYVRTALLEKILPIPGQEVSAPFSPAKLLERGEAAAYIWNALAAKSKMRIQSSSSESSVSEGDSAAASSAVSELEKRAAAALRVMEQEKRSLERALANTRNVTVPFSDKGIFDGKTQFSYEFGVDDPIVVDVLAGITEWNNGTITCRLFHLGRSGFSQEYYLGFQEGKNCSIRAALGAGSWRLELTPEKLAPSFTVSVKTTKGDGNDGFSQALTLPLNKVRSDSLDLGDLEDWFTFTIPKEGTNTDPSIGRQMTLDVSSSDALGCLIYPLDDVDQYGFKGPECGFRYVYSAGTYMVTVRHATPLNARQSYSIQIK